MNNLSEFIAYLIAAGNLPIHFLKVIEFKPSQGAMSKPATLFMHLLLQNLLKNLNEIDKIQEVFEKGLDDKEGKKASFVKGFSEFILGKFYLRIKKEHEKDGGKIPRELSKKLKTVFKVINEIKKDEDMF